MSEEVEGARREGVRVRDARQGNPREEGVVQEAAFEAEMDEGVESVPDEEEAAGLGDGAVEHQQRCAVCDAEDRESRG